MNEEDHVHVEQSFALDCWDFLLNCVFFAIIALLLGWFAHLIWNSLGIDPALSWMNCFGIILLFRFVGFAFNYDLGS